MEKFRLTITLRSNAGRRPHVGFCVALSLLLLTAAKTSCAHGFAGARFFPATLALDDPFVADELSLPTFSSIRTADDRGTRAFNVAIELAKRITPSFGVEIGETFSILKADEENSVNGLGNVEFGAKYQLLTNEKHEAILSLGLAVEIGGTGARSIGAESFNVWTPAVFFGKGFGDLPETIRFLKPIAVTGSISISIPSTARTRTETTDEMSGLRVVELEHHPDVLEWGFVLEYSLIHLQANVKDLHLPAPLDRTIPLIEFAMETPLDRGERKITGTINPGVIWSGQYWQFGIEAIIPVNAQTGNNVGVIMQLHFYLDDLFPRSFGRPLIE